MKNGRFRIPELGYRNHVPLSEIYSQMPQSQDISHFVEVCANIYRQSEIGKIFMLHSRFNIFPGFICGEK